MLRSEIFETSAPIDVRDIVFIPIFLADSMALMQLGDEPLVVNTRRTSSLFPNASICLEKMVSNPKSLAIDVITEESVESAIAGKALRFMVLEYALMNSAAKCCESAALPPFPQIRSLPPDSKTEIIA